MKGHDEILQMRKAGRTPTIVFINDYPCQTNWAEYGAYATVCVFGDSVNSLDLRFLVGIAVSVSASTESRAKALFNACKRHGAKTVAVCHVQNDKKPWEQSGWTEIWHG
jgi:hypothetical protein